MSLDPARARPTATTRTYRAIAWKHPAQVPLIALAAIFALLTCTVVLPLSVVFFAEIVLLFAVPRIGAFQRWADRRMAIEQWTAATAERSRLLERMVPAHRQELERLELLVAETMATCGVDGLVGDWHGLYEALAAYTRLSITARRLEAVFAPHVADMVTRQLDALELHRTREGWVPAPHVEERLQILRQRRAVHAEMMERRRAIDGELAVIADTIRYVREACIAASAAGAPFDARDLTHHVASTVTGLRELARLQGDVTCEPAVFERVRIAVEPPLPRGGDPQAEVVVVDAFAGPPVRGESVVLAAHLNS